MPRWAALPLQGLVFALYHLNVRPVSLASKTLPGMLFGGARGRDGSLVACAVPHAMLWTVVGTV